MGEETEVCRGPGSFGGCIAGTSLQPWCYFVFLPTPLVPAVPARWLLPQPLLNAFLAASDLRCLSAVLCIILLAFFTQASFPACFLCMSMWGAQETALQSSLRIMSWQPHLRQN